MKKSPTKTAPAWHAEAVKLIHAHYPTILAALHDSLHRAVWFGALLISIKQRGKDDGSIPHGRFLPWLKANYTDLNKRTAQEWMTAAKRAFELSEKAKILPFSTDAAEGQKRDSLRFCPGAELPKEVQTVIAGKTKYALFLDWKQAKATDDDTLEPAIGRPQGEGGRPPEPTGTIEEIVAARAKQSLHIGGRAVKELERLGYDFMGWDDAAITAHLSALERTIKCQRAWLNTPPEKRDMQAIKQLWETL